MSLANYADLQAAVADWLHRTDLSAQIPNFITLAETKINNNIRARRLETTFTATTTAGTNGITLPTDYSALKTIQIAGSTNTILNLVPAQILLEYNSQNTTGTPKFFCIQGTTVQFSPIPDSAYTVNIVYYQDVPSLITNGTNWLMTQFPYVYLYGTLLEACTWLQDQEQYQIFQKYYDDSIEDIWQNYSFESFSGSKLRCTSSYIM